MRPTNPGLRLPAFLVLAFAATPVAATDFCIVQQSPDGFVALRSTPSPEGELLVRTKPGEAVIIQKNGRGDQIASGSWLRVMHFPDAVAPPKTDPGYKRGRIGWMHKRFVDECG